jgi:hypothetical protein
MDISQQVFRNACPNLAHFGKKFCSLDAGFYGCYNRGMPLHDDPDDPILTTAYERTRWFEAVLEVEYGERPAHGEIPPELNWLALLPPSHQFDLDEVECSLAYVSAGGDYQGVIWEATGEDDRPWVLFLVDDYGVRLLAEYSALEEDISDDDLDVILARSSAELPERLLSGEFDRSGTPITIPDWLVSPSEDEEE